MFLLWYIWKAHNNNKFQRKTWTANQIQLAAATHINAHLDALQNPILPPLEDLSHYTKNISAGTGQRFSATDPFLVSFPSSIAGTRCYTDAATLPDNNTFVTKQADLGVFIINTEENPPTSIFIKAFMQESSSVLMAESAALALATNLLNQIQCRRSIILYDNQQLVHFLNEPNHSNPPDWRIKSYTQSAANLLSNNSLQVRRIKRSRNQMADSLARHAFQAIRSNNLEYYYSCTNPSHANDCPILRVINSVTISTVMVLSPSCC